MVLELGLDRRICRSVGAVCRVGDGTESGPAQEEQPEKITLTFRHFWNKEHDKPVLAVFESIVRTYEKAHPNVKVNFESIDQTIHREQKLKSEMVTGTPPDMFVLFGGPRSCPMPDPTG